MAHDKVAIRILPTPATQDLPEKDLQWVARVTKMSPDHVRDRITSGKGITIVTPDHPRISELVKLLKTKGFSVTSGPAAPQEPSVPKRKSKKRTVRSKKSRPKQEITEWAVGDIIENLYEVEDIKQGGMGAVYLVRHRRWNAMMAVKSLLQRLRSNEEDRALFVKEAETWIDIGFHPNIAACYYVRNINRSPRIFIEYVDGGSLSEWFNRHRQVGWDIVIDLMVQVCDGLDHAHSKGLVHRDIKPANCMLTKEGIIKVTDFGLTKRRGIEPVADPSSTSSGISEAVDTSTVVRDRESVTAAGMGTPGYMAPEMWIPKSEVGPGADIYAFGVMFFEICCRRKPFVLRKGEKRDKLALAHLKQPPPRPTLFRKDMPPILEEIILKCLQKDPYERYVSFGVLREELAGAFEDIFKRRFTRQRPDEVKLVPDALNNRAVSLMDLNHHDEAEAALHRALETDPHHPEAVYNLGMLDWFRNANPDNELIVKMQEVINTPEYKGRGAHLLSRCLLTLGDTEGALKAANVSLSADDFSDEWLKPYGIALIGKGNDSSAITQLEKYLEAFSADMDAIGWLIGALVRLGRVKEALARIEALPSGSEFASVTPVEIAEAYRYSGLEERLRLEGHKAWVTCVAHFPKSARIITGSRDRTLKIWDAENGDELHSIPIIGEPPNYLWISTDEKLVAIGTNRPGVPAKVLDLETGKFVGNLLAHEGPVTALGFSPDGKHVLTVEGKGVARLWDAKDFRAVTTYKVPQNLAAEVIFDSESRPDIFVACRDRLIRRVNPVDSQELVFEKVHNELITGLKVSRNGSLVLSGARDRLAVAWDGGTGKKLSECRAHEDAVSALAVNQVRFLAASYDAKANIKLWNPRTGAVIRTFTSGDAETECLAFTRDGANLLAGGRDMVLRVWDVRGRRIEPDLALAKIRSVTKQMKSDRQFKATLDRAKQAFKTGALASAYSLLRKAQTYPGHERSDEALEMILRMKDHGKRVGLQGGWNKKTVETPAGVMHLRFSPSAINFLTAQADHSIRMWSTKTGDALKTLGGHTNLVAAISFSLNGREAVSGGDDRTIRLWDLHGGRNTVTLKAHSESVSSVVYSPDGTRILSGSWDGTAKLWSVPDGTPIRTFKGPGDKIGSVAFIPNTDLVLGAGFDGIIRMWECSSGRHLRDMRAHKDRITSLDVSACGGLFLSGSMDGTAGVWDVRTGGLLKTLEADKSGVRAVRFSPEKTYAVTGGNDYVLRLWNVDEGKCLREFQGHNKEITSVDFASNGRFVISASADGTVIIWELDWHWQFPEQKGALRPSSI